RGSARAGRVNCATEDLGTLRDHRRGCRWWLAPRPPRDLGGHDVETALHLAAQVREGVLDPPALLPLGPHFFDRALLQIGEVVRSQEPVEVAIRHAPRVPVRYTPIALAM